jgi:hypothetical protein
VEAIPLRLHPGDDLRLKLEANDLFLRVSLLHRSDLNLGLIGL